jgi:hypothetical protein
MAAGLVYHMPGLMLAGRKACHSGLVDAVLAVANNTLHLPLCSAFSAVAQQAECHMGTVETTARLWHLAWCITNRAKVYTAGVVAVVNQVLLLLSLP